MSWLRLMEESIQENESALTGEETKAVQQLPVRKKHTVSGLIKEMWPAYLIEILVIILGISITLALEEWRDRNREAQLEKIYLNNLLADVDADQQILHDVIVSTQKILDSGNELLQYSKNLPAKDFSSRKTNADVRAILGRPKFISHDATFSDLKSSGNLHLLKDIRLKNNLFAYYSLTQNIKEMQDAEQQATITLSGSYFLKRFPIDDADLPSTSSQPEESKMLLKTFEFNNNVLLRVLNRKELLDEYQRADSTALVLSKALSKRTDSP
ncbi:MAG: hypothetical protein M3N30_04545 [Bacteroidota bacterium]|nr:hypothetical protein [Bacteroidota bacterium]